MALIRQCDICKREIAIENHFITGKFAKIYTENGIRLERALNEVNMKLKSQFLEEVEMCPTCFKKIYDLIHSKEREKE